MITKTEPSFTVTVYIAGDMQTARESLRRQCFHEGLCVTLTPTSFIYTGGAEEGVAVGFVNYPRFPKTNQEIADRALRVAMQLMRDLCQLSAMIVTPVETTWLTNRTEDQK